MNMLTRVSGKGQVVVPKAVRDRQGWSTGTDLEVVETENGVLLRPSRSGRKLTVGEAVARFRQLYSHEGPPVSLDEMDEAIAEGAARRALR